jgi:glycosyltransferase involved in cell wall biosynthesis
LRCGQAVLDHRPDVVLTSGPPHVVHLLGRHLHRWTGLPWVADFRDPWITGDPSQVNRDGKRWKVRAEQNVMRQADAIIANTPRALELLSDAYPRYAAKMTAITNGYDPWSFQPNLVPPLSGSAVEIVHTGTIYAYRSPTPFLEAVRQLEPAALSGRKLRVRFIGSTIYPEQKEETENKIREVVNAAVSLEDPVPYAQAIRAMVQADVLLLLDTPGRQAGVPAKLYEYIGAGRPVLALAEPDSDVAWVLRESGVAHRVAPPLDVAAIRRALTDLLQDPATPRCPGRHPAIQTRFTRNHLAGELAALLDACPRVSSWKAGDRSLSEAAR